MDRGAWRAGVHGVPKRGTRLMRLGTHVYVELIHFAAQQKLTQHCKATILQQKLIKKKESVASLRREVRPVEPS